MDGCTLALPKVWPALWLSDGNTNQTNLTGTELDSHVTGKAGNGAGVAILRNEGILGLFLPPLFSGVLAFTLEAEVEGFLPVLAWDWGCRHLQAPVPSPDCSSGKSTGLLGAHLHSPREDFHLVQLGFTCHLGPTITARKNPESVPSHVVGMVVGGDFNQKLHRAEKQFLK